MTGPAVVPVGDLPPALGVVAPRLTIHGETRCAPVILSSNTHTPDFVVKVPLDATPGLV
jgi:hypothetical protein